MRALPVHALATNALLELIAPRGNARRNPVADVVFGSRTEQFVARHAARERTKAPGQIETLHYLGSLAAAIRLAHPVPMRHGGVFE